MAGKQLLGPYVGVVERTNVSASGGVGVKVVGDDWRNLSRSYHGPKPVDGDAIEYYVDGGSPKFIQSLTITQQCDGFAREIVGTPQPPHANHAAAQAAVMGHASGPLPAPLPTATAPAAQPLIQPALQAASGPSAKDVLIVRQTAIKAAAEYSVGRGDMTEDRVLAFADRMVAYVLEGPREVFDPSTGAFTLV